MAKAADIEVDPEEPFAAAGSRIVRMRTEELFAHADGVLDTDDIERVHDMRVATRRLRAVLEIFASCFPKPEFRAALRDVKRLADALGERRDPDVQLAALRAFAALIAPGQRPGIAKLIERAEGMQGAGNATLEAALEDVESSGLQGRLLALAEAAS